MSGLDEDQVRKLVEEAVWEARNTTVGNMCEEAVVQRVLKEHYIPGRGWRSRYFEQPIPDHLIGDGTRSDIPGTDPADGSSRTGDASSVPGCSP